MTPPPSDKLPVWRYSVPPLRAISLALLTLVFLVIISGQSLAGTGRALAIGLNDVSAAYYTPKPLPLPVCEADARAMADIASKRGFDTKLLTGCAASMENVRAEITKAARELKEGDIFVVSFSGHGSIVEDWNGNGDEEYDQLWCLHDGQMIDDELALLWSTFAKGVRIVLYSDSCHSGSVIKTADARQEAEGVMVKEVSKELQAEITGKGLPGWRQSPSSRQSQTRIKASVISITACEDLAKSYILNGDSNSLFTRVLMECWKDGEFDGDYTAFHLRIREHAGALARAKNLVQLAQKNQAGQETDKLFNEKPWTK